MDGEREREGGREGRRGEGREGEMVGGKEVGKESRGEWERVGEV